MIILAGTVFVYFFVFTIFALLATLVLELIEGLRPIAERKGCSVPVLCIAWLKAQTPLMNLLVGARRMESLKDTLLALDVDLTTEDVNEMNALADRAAAGVK